ncbi:MAG: hypothetical protein ABEK01_05760 [Candidatus Nanohaloarchaea archaeon]
MSRSGREKQGGDLFSSGMELTAGMMLLPLKMNPFIPGESSSDDGYRGDDWDFRTRRDLRQMVEEGYLEEPGEYGFDSYREMKRFVRGRHEEAGNSYDWSRSDREEMNQHSPRKASPEQALRSFTSAFHPDEDVEGVQRLLESAAEIDGWELDGDMVDVMKEYGRLVTEGEAELSLSSGEEEVMVRFESRNGLYPEVEVLYRDGDGSEREYLGEVQDLSGPLEELG